MAGHFGQPKIDRKEFSQLVKAEVPSPETLDILLNSSLLWDNNPNLLQVLNEIDFETSDKEESESPFNSLPKKRKLLFGFVWLKAK